MKTAPKLTKKKVSVVPVVEANHAAAPDLDLDKLARAVAVAETSPPDKHAMLAAACGHDKKCTCINRAIFVHDSSFATAGVGARANNPCNMRKPGSWKPKGVVGQTKGAVGYFLVFDTLENGIKACVETYQRFYKDAPPRALVSAWTAGGGQGHYQAAVSACFL